MRKIAIAGILSALLWCVAALPADAANVVRAFTCLTGGTTGCVDKIPIAEIADGDIGVGVVSGTLYVYQFSAAAVDAESSPTYIRPDDFATAGVWVLADTVAKASNILTQLKVPSSNAAPTATAGYLRHDSTVANHADGAVRWHDGTNIRQLVDMVAATAEGCADTQVVAYNATTDLWYCKDDEGGSGPPTLVAVADTTDATAYCGLFESATGDLGPKTDAGCTYAADTGTLTVTALAAGSVTTTAVASPTATFNDVDAPGTGKDVAKIVAAYIDGADGAENGTLSLYAHIAGTSTEMLKVDGKNSKIDLGAIKLVTTGTLAGGIPINTDANGMTSGEMTTAGMYGTMFVATGAGTWNLPAAAAGMNFCVLVPTAAAVIINPDASDVLVYDGTADTAGHEIAGGAASGDFLCFVAIDTTNWHSLGRRGTWTPGS